MLEKRDLSLKVGEGTTLKASFMSKTVLLYTGMPNRETFSVAVTFTSGHASHAYTLFYPKSRRRLEIRNSLIEVLTVTPDEMRVNVLVKPKSPMG